MYPAVKSYGIYITICTQHFRSDNAVYSAGVGLHSQIMEGDDL